MRLSGWGNYPVVEARELAPRCAEEAIEYTADSTPGITPLIARGLGRSYGDSALAANVLSTRYLNNYIGFDNEAGILRCAAGVSLASILETFVPRGWFPYVTPGTKYVTVGGAIASDVHGKNHHIDGCFSDHVLAMKVATPAEGVVACSADERADLFHATAGGMGLTGLVLEATIKLRPVSSCWIEETTIRTANLWDTLEAFELHRDSTYSVAWIDCLAQGSALGRSVLSLGEHMESGGFQPASRTRLSIPVDFPAFALNKHSVRLFNTLKYNTASSQRQTRKTHYDNYFYPLDSIGNWNRMYGESGFAQYQFVLPKEAGRDGLVEILTRISRSGAGSFLAVLKSFGSGNANHLSFPIAGYTLALDFKLSPGILELLDELDRVVLAHNGRIYLTKDSRMSAETLRSSYSGWEQFAAIRKRYGADTVFHSAQSQRLEL